MCFKRVLFLPALTLLFVAGCGDREESNPVKPATTEAFADVVVRDTTVYTLNPAQPWAEALAIRDGIIVMVGSDTEAEALTGPETRVLSQPGGMVLPGFQDAHIHPLTSGVDQFDCNLDLPDQSLDALQARVAECNLNMPNREWLSGGGWWTSAFPPDGIPDKTMLDAVVADRPAVFFSVDGHTAWTNSLAMEIAGITADTPDPVNGRIDRDPRTGEPVGSFQESAMELIREHLPPPPQSQLDDGMRYSINYLHSLGITAMQEANVSIDADDRVQALATYRRFADSGELQLHTVI